MRNLLKNPSVVTCITGGGIHSESNNACMHGLTWSTSSFYYRHTRAKPASNKNGLNNGMWGKGLNSQHFDNILQTFSWGGGGGVMTK